MYLHPNDIWLLKDDACFYPEWSAVEGMLRYKSKNYPDRFLRHVGWRLWIDTNNGSQLFKDDAAWKMTWGNKASTESVPDFLNPKPTVEGETEPAFDFSSAKLLDSAVEDRGGVVVADNSAGQSQESYALRFDKHRTTSCLVQSE